MILLLVVLVCCIAAVICTAVQRTDWTYTIIGVGLLLAIAIINTPALPGAK